MDAQKDLMHEIVNEEFAERERKADMHCEMASQLR